MSGIISMNIAEVTLTIKTSAKNIAHGALNNDT